MLLLETVKWTEDFKLCEYIKHFDLNDKNIKKVKNTKKKWRK